MYMYVYSLSQNHFPLLLSCVDTAFAHDVEQFAPADDYAYGEAIGTFFMRVSCVYGPWVIGCFDLIVLFVLVVLF